MTMKVGFIGLGIMGKPMSKNLLKAGYSLVVADRNPEAIADVIAAGAETASTAKAIAEQCDVIITMLPNSPHVKEVALGENGIIEGAKPGTVLIDMSSIAPLASRYPPEGIRGVSVSHRANMFGTVADYFAQSNKNITILVQIESQQGVDNVDAIAATEGVDGIFVGPSDLAAALGHLGNASHPDVQKAIQHIFNRASAHGKPSGILAPVEADARRYLEWGATFVAVGSDLGVFRSATQKLADTFKK